MIPQIMCVEDEKAGGKCHIVSSDKTIKDLTSVVNKQATTLSSLLLLLQVIIVIYNMGTVI